MPGAFGIFSSRSGVRRATTISLSIAGAVAALAILWWLLPVADGLRAGTDWIRGTGVPGMILFMLIGVLAHLALAPASLFYLAAGLVYGPAAGFALAYAAAIGAAVVAFVVARTLGRRRITAWLDGRARLAALDQAVRDEGWKVVLILRLSPLIPGPVQSYAFGLTRVPLASFLAATLVGVAPWVLVFSWLGAAGSAVFVTGDDTFGLDDAAPIAAGLAVLSLAAWRLTRRAKTYLEARDSGA